MASLPKSLPQIVAELRALSTSSPSKRFPGNYAVAAGELILQADILGAFQRIDSVLDRFRLALQSCRSVCSQTTGANRPNLPLSVFLEAVKLFAPEYQKENDWPEACRKIAAVIQAAKQLPAAVPEKGGEKGGGGSTPEEAAIARKAAWGRLPNRARKAYSAFQYAAEKNGVKPQDLTAPDAHKWLSENGIDQEKGDVDILTDYKPPTPGTFQRYLSMALNGLDENKYTPRAGRPAGPSIVKGDEIEYQRGDDD